MTATEPGTAPDAPGAVDAVDVVALGESAVTFLPVRDHADRLAAPDDAAWGRPRPGPGRTQADARAEEEVCTP
ncbi:hypothetical protein SUDANB6_02203 [Streptomyces sp. enrichment culture]|uniref:hypothetical protein n=1 Tax=Streptomyces sp. enrichment culture TaxID=1795815 RepID=UPI003F553C17